MLTTESEWEGVQEAKSPSTIETGKAHVISNEMTSSQQQSCKTLQPPADLWPLRMPVTWDPADQHYFAFNFKLKLHLTTSMHKIVKFQSRLFLSLWKISFKFRVGAIEGVT